MPATGGASLTSSTPDALWSAPSLRVLRPSAVSCAGLRRGRELDRCSLSVPVGARLLIVSEPDTSASTLLRVLAGLSRISRGEVRIAGSTDPTAAGWGLRMAYLGSESGLHTWMTPLETLHLAAGLLGLSNGERARRIDRALTWTGITPGMAARAISRGGPELEQRTGLAAALIAEPEVLLLDEPLRAIEATERARMLRLPGRRLTILLASRYPASEVGLVAHVAYLRNGRIQFIAPIGDLDRAGLPLSHAGIAELGALMAAERRLRRDPPP
ncbi:MAG: ATP-binding cassette domain-containing protein [Chloroflexota bacterium]|nr:ATP-binding cassette domain-containing protein [Chloroflexota bacterium]